MLDNSVENRAGIYKIKTFDLVLVLIRFHLFQNKSVKTLGCGFTCVITLHRVMK